MKILYVAHGTDKLGLHALNILLAKGCETTTLVSGQSASDITLHEPQALFVGLFASPGQYPNRHLRLLRKRDVERRGFVIPIWAGVMGHRIALRPRSEHWTPDQGFRAAIEDLDHLLSRTRRPKALRLERASGYHARKRRDAGASSFVSGDWGDAVL